MAAKAATLAPWDIIPAESAIAYSAFAIYRDMGLDRTAVAVAVRCQKHVSLINRWSQAYDWPERARAWDEHVIALATPKAAAAQAAALARHIAHGVTLQEWGAGLLPTAVKDATPADAIRAVKTGIDIERQGLGIPDRAPVDEEGKAVAATIAIIRMDPDAL